MSKYHQNSQPLQKSNLSAFITFSVGCYPQNPIIKIFHWILLSLCCLIIILILPPWILPIGYCKNQSLHYQNPRSNGISRYFHYIPTIGYIILNGLYIYIYIFNILITIFPGIFHYIFTRLLRYSMVCHYLFHWIIYI